MIRRTRELAVTENYHVRLKKDNLVFSAAHFITYNGNICERLHGHNYRVAAEVYGPLDENQYVVDFIALRDLLQSIVGQLDHHMLLPTNHPSIHVDADDEAVEVRFEDRRWVFPRDDCILLPVENTTAEQLARFIGRRLGSDLKSQTGFNADRIRVEVDENEGQIAVWDSGHG